MTRAQAITKLKQLYGTRAYWRVGDRISRADDREMAREQIKATREARDTASAQMTARAKALCDADVEYQAAKTIYLARKTELERLQHAANYYRFEAGTADVNKLIGCNVIHISAHGDTWEEVFNELWEKKVTA